VEPLRPTVKVPFSPKAARRLKQAAADCHLPMSDYIEALIELREWALGRAMDGEGSAAQLGAIDIKQKMEALGLIPEY